MTERQAPRGAYERMQPARRALAIFALVAGAALAYFVFVVWSVPAHT
jgi:hypothetical protein